MLLHYSEIGDHKPAMDQPTQAEALAVAQVLGMDLMFHTGWNRWFAFCFSDCDFVAGLPITRELYGRMVRFVG